MTDATENSRSKNYNHRRNHHHPSRTRRFVSKNKKIMLELYLPRKATVEHT